MASLKRPPGIETFAKAWATAFKEALGRSAGRDGRLSMSEARRMWSRTDGDQFFADDAMKFMRQRNIMSTSVRRLEEWAEPYARGAGEMVAGEDGIISFVDAGSLPPTLIEDFYLLRGRALTSGPASELHFLERQLQPLLAGVVVMSETDASLRFISSAEPYAGPIDENAVRTQLGAAHDEVFARVMSVDPADLPLATRSPVQEVDFDEFFEARRNAFDPADAFSVQNAARFEAIEQELRASLTDLKVFRFGQINISTFIVGRTRTGELAGLLTGQVET